MYMLTDTFVLKDDGTCIPIDTGNTDYQVFLAWQAAGNVPTILNQFPTLKTNELATFKNARDSLIAQLTGIAVAANASVDTVTANGAIAARQSIIDLLNQPSVLAATTLQDLKSALAAERLKIIQAMPLSLKQALNKLS